MQAEIEEVTRRDWVKFGNIRTDWKSHGLFPHPHEIDLLIDLVEKLRDLQKASTDASIR